MPDIKIKDFGIRTTEEWARFVMNNRSREFQEIKSELCNKDNKYDIVIGPVADDNMALLFRQYENEIIDFETLLRGIIYKKASSQYSIEKLQDQETGLYLESPEYIYDLFKDEMNFGYIIQAEI